MVFGIAIPDFWLGIIPVLVSIGQTPFTKDPFGNLRYLDLQADLGVA